ncbi:protein kinase [Planctomycetales bacterium ZRK34]|nr:protein kinase [Planctomycetales bacterium ZRK34]
MPFVSHVDSNDSNANHASPRPPQEPVHHVPGYELIALHGEGGMGTVWRARQLATGRDVALKMMRSDVIGSSKKYIRFEREVALSSRLEHPNIARVYDSGIAQGVYFYAMEFVDGIQLDQYVRNCGLERDEMLTLFIEVCKAIQYAHQRGVLHRDLKPSNILVTADGKPHVVDFGLAIHADVRNREYVTAVGDFAGTLPYMSPEQVQGKLSAIDIRTDIYALGVILHELLAGTTPHEQTGSRVDLQNRILAGQFPRPLGQSDLIDKELESVIFKALSLAPEDRYSSVHDLAVDVQNYLSGNPISVRPLTLGYFLRKWVGRHRISVTIATFTILMFLAIIVFAFVSISASQAEAEAEAKAARHALYLAKYGYAKTELERNNYAKSRAILDSTDDEQRGWEWYYLRHMADQSIWTVYSEDAYILGVGYDPEDKTLLAVTRQRHVIRIQPHSGNTTDRFMLEAPSSIVRFVDFVPRGPILGTTYQGDVIAWDSHTGQTLWTYKALNEVAVALAVSVHGDVAAVSDAKGNISTINVSTGIRRSHFQASGPIKDIAFSTDGQLLVCAESNASVWAIDEPRLVQNVNIGSTIKDAVFNANGTELLTIDDKGSISLTETQNWRRVTKLGLESGSYTQVGFIANTSDYYAIGSDGGIRRFSENSQPTVSIFNGHSGMPVQVCSFADLPYLVSYARNEVKCWNPQRRILTTIDVTQGSPINTLAIGPHGKLLAAAVRESICIYDLDGGTERVLHENIGVINALSFNTTGSQLAVTGSNRCGVLLETNTGRRLHEWQYDQGDPHWISFTPDDKAILVGTGQCIYAISSVTGSQLYQVLNEEHLISTYSHKTNRITACVPSDENDSLNRLIFLDVNTMKLSESSPLRDHVAHLVSGDVDTDYVAWSTNGNDLTTYNILNGSVEQRFPDDIRHRYINAIMSPDAKRVITTIPMVQVWDTASGTPMIQLDNPIVRTPFNLVRFSRDGTTIATASMGNISVWTVPGM